MEVRGSHLGGTVAPGRSQSQGTRIPSAGAAKGHTVPRTSPWNTPVFVICKQGQDRWRLLEDLRKVKEVIVTAWPALTFNAPEIETGSY